MILTRNFNGLYTTFCIRDEKNEVYDEKLLIHCWTSDGRVGFQHRCNVYLNNHFNRYGDKFFKVQYYNRTWEKFHYQSLLEHVLRSLLKDKAITKEEYAEYHVLVETFS